MIRKIHIYHHNDNDGKFAAALMYQYFKRYDKRYRKTLFYSIDYITEINLENIPMEDCLIFVDYSFSNQHNADQLLKAHERNIPIVWIDHHKSSEHFLWNVLGRDVYGIQEQDNLVTYYDTTFSATRLCWNYCRSRAIVKSEVEPWDKVKTYTEAEYIANNIPNFIKYVDDYDLWKFSKGDNAHLFHYGVNVQEYNLKTLINDILSERDVAMSDSYNIFEDQIDSINKKSFKFIQDVLGVGGNILKYNDVRYNLEREFGAFQFKIVDTFTTKNKLTWTGVAMNIHSNSESFGDLYNKYDIVCPFVMSKHGLWKYSLFSKMKDPNLDLSKYAEILGSTKGGSGGGGHAKASGFQHYDLLLAPNVVIYIKPKAFSKKPVVSYEILDTDLFEKA